MAIFFRGYLSDFFGLNLPQAVAQTTVKQKLKKIPTKEQQDIALQFKDSLMLRKTK